MDEVALGLEVVAAFGLSIDGVPGDDPLLGVRVAGSIRALVCRFSPSFPTAIETLVNLGVPVTSGEFRLLAPARTGTSSPIPTIRSWATR